MAPWFGGRQGAKDAPATALGAIGGWPCPLGARPPALSGLPRGTEDPRLPVQADWIGSRTAVAMALQCFSRKQSYRWFVSRRGTCRRC